MDDAAGATSGPLAAFRSREFTTFFSAGLVSNIGTWMQIVTVPYVIDQLTHSTALVGVAVFCTYFPSTVVSPLAGSLSDRHDRRIVLIWSQVVMALMAGALWALWATGSATVGLILACVVVGAVGNGLSMSAWQAYVPQLVPRPALLSAVRINSMSLTGARAFGPALAGLVLATLGPSAAFGINALSFLVVIGALLMLTPRPPGAVEHHGVLRHFLEGLRYTARRQVFIVPVFAVFVLGMFGVGISQLVEPFARHVLSVGAGVYGLLTAGYGVGAVIGSALVVAFADSFRRSSLATLGLVGMAAGAVLFGVSPVWPVTIGALMVMGFCQVACAVSCNTALQLNVDDEYRGRVSSLFLMSFFAAAPLGALLGGFVGEAVGLRPTLMASGVILGVLTAWALVHWHRLRPLDEANPVLDETPVAPRAPAADAWRADRPIVPDDEDVRRTA